MNSQNISHHIKFGLLVTGKTERKHIPKLFRVLAKTGACHFIVQNKIEQLSPRTSDKAHRRLKTVGRGDYLPTRDQEIGEQVAKFLRQAPNHYLILVDDLENARRSQVEAIFQRYRQAVDLKLTEHEKKRAFVFFLVNMLEAYYFADAASVNQVLKLLPPLKDEIGDVEDLGHPKNDLKRICKKSHISFREKEHGGQILAKLDLAHVLSRPETCAWLRGGIGWMVEVLLNLPEEVGVPRDLGVHFLLAEGRKTSLIEKQSV